MNKILVTLLVALYTIPYVFLGMYCQWIDYGLLMTSFTFLTFIPPFVYAYFCAKKRLKYVLIYGNILTFMTSLVLTFILNVMGLTDELGGSWYGTFKPLNSIQMVVVCSVISAIIQSIIYHICKTKKDYTQISIYRKDRRCKMSEFRYNDILNMPYPNPEIEKDFPDKILRAAQFAPFAALTGYDEAVEETARLTDSKVELDEYQKAELNEKLLFLDSPVNDEEVSITYFVPDKRKSGGAYITKKGIVLKVREYEKDVVMDDGTEILIDDIIEIDGNQFNETESI